MIIEICLILLLIISFSLCFTFNNFKEEYKKSFQELFLRVPRKLLSNRNPSPKDEANMLGDVWENTSTGETFFAMTKWVLIKKK